MSDINNCPVDLSGCENECCKPENEVRCLKMGKTCPREDCMELREQDKLCKEEEETFKQLAASMDETFVPVQKKNKELKNLKNKMEHLYNKEEFANELQYTAINNYIFNTRNNSQYVKSNTRIDTVRAMPTRLIGESSKMLGLNNKALKMPRWSISEKFGNTTNLNVKEKPLDLRPMQTRAKKSEKETTVSLRNPGILQARQTKNAAMYSVRKIGKNTKF